jgi:hypothetical protein
MCCNNIKKHKTRPHRKFSIPGLLVFKTPQERVKFWLRMRKLIAQHENNSGLFPSGDLGDGRDMGPIEI